MQLAAVVHLLYHVATAKKFLVDVELRNSRPVRISFDPLSDFGIFQHVDRSIVRYQVIQNADDCGGEAALRLCAGTFHVEHDFA